MFWSFVLGMLWQVQCEVLQLTGHLAEMSSGAGDVAQVVKRLSNMHENPGFDS